MMDIGMSYRETKLHQSQEGGKYDNHGTCLNDLRNKDACDGPQEDNAVINTDISSGLSVGTSKGMRRMRLDDSLNNNSTDVQESDSKLIFSKCDCSNEGTCLMDLKNKDACNDSQVNSPVTDTPTTNISASLCLGTCKGRKRTRFNDSINNDSSDFQKPGSEVILSRSDHSNKGNFLNDLKNKDACDAPRENSDVINTSSTDISSSLNLGTIKGTKRKRLDDSVNNYSADLADSDSEVILLKNNHSNELQTQIPSESKLSCSIDILVDASLMCKKIKTDAMEECTPNVEHESIISSKMEKCASEATECDSTGIERNLEESAHGGSFDSEKVCDVGKIIDDSSTHKLGADMATPTVSLNGGEFGTNMKEESERAFPPEEDGQVLHPSPEKPLGGSSKRKLLVLDLNGLLADVLPFCPAGHKPDITITMKSVFRRPFCSEFLQFCFQKFDLGVWSSRTKQNMEKLLDFLFGDSRHQLLFCWDQSRCTYTGLTTPGHRSKPLFLKELKKLWRKHDPDLPWEKDHYNESNTVLLDDSPYKALRNPPYTAIFPPQYRYIDSDDNLLGPCGGLRIYLEGLVQADDVRKYVSENPFGQPPVTESHPDWQIFRKALALCHDDGDLHRHGRWRKAEDEGSRRYGPCDDDDRRWRNVEDHDSHGWGRWDDDDGQLRKAKENGSHQCGRHDNDDDWQWKKAEDDDTHRCGRDGGGGGSRRCGDNDNARQEWSRMVLCYGQQGDDIDRSWRRRRAYDDDSHRYGRRDNVHRHGRRRKVEDEGSRRYGQCNDDDRLWRNVEDHDSHRWGRWDDDDDGQVRKEKDDGSHRCGRQDDDDRQWKKAEDVGTHRFGRDNGSGGGGSSRCGDNNNASQKWSHMVMCQQGDDIDHSWRRRAYDDGSYRYGQRDDVHGDDIDRSWRRRRAYDDGSHRYGQRDDVHHHA